MRGILIAGELKGNTLTFQIKDADAILTAMAGGLATGQSYIIKMVEPKKNKLSYFGLKTKVSKVFNEAIKNRLHSAGILTISDLVNTSKSELVLIRGFGKIALKQVEHALSSNDLKLRE